MKRKNPLVGIFTGMMMGVFGCCLLVFGVVVTIGNKLPTSTPTRTATNTLTPTATLTPSETLTPSATFTPSLTPTASETFTPSSTPTASDTFTPTSTPTFTPTLSSTDVAGTLNANISATAQVKHDSGTATAQSVNDDATIAAQGRRDTATAIVDNRNATSTTAADNRQATIDAKGVTATFVAGYKTIVTGQLVTYADNHIGETVRIQGTVLSIIDVQTLQVWLNSTDAVYVTLADGQFLDSVYKGDAVTVYGTVQGYVTGTNGFGAKIKQAALKDAVVTKP